MPLGPPQEDPQSDFRAMVQRFPQARMRTSGRTTSVPPATRRGPAAQNYLSTYLVTAVSHVVKDQLTHVALRGYGLFATGAGLALDDLAAQMSG
jgi:hypothetical protein